MIDWRPRTCDQVGYNFGIAVGLKNRTLAFQLIPETLGVNQVPIVRDRNLTAGIAEHQRLSVQKSTVSGCCVTYMSDGLIPFEFQVFITGKDLTDQTLSASGMDGLSVRNTDAGAFLATML